MAGAALNLALKVASDHYAQIVGVPANDNLVFDVCPPLPSGAPGTTYRLLVEASGKGLVARELSPSRLPSFCPERHINIDGTFCLFWSAVEPADIADEEAARRWWGKVLVFLRRQQSASILSQWPGRSQARAHGEDAAISQFMAEMAVRQIGRTFRDYLERGRLSTSKGRSTIRLLLDGKRVLSVRSTETKKVMTRRSGCKCGTRSRPLAVCACADHEIELANLTRALERWKTEEQRFFEIARASGKQCCGSLTICPLRT